MSKRGSSVTALSLNADGRSKQLLMQKSAHQDLGPNHEREYQDQLAVNAVVSHIDFRKLKAGHQVDPQSTRALARSKSSKLDKADQLARIYQVSMKDIPRPAKYTYNQYNSVRATGNH